jgi:hypothetical protein
MTLYHTGLELEKQGFIKSPFPKIFAMKDHEKADGIFLRSLFLSRMD